MEIHGFLTWATQHQHWVIAAVFLVSLAESLAVLGLVVPGAALMLASGTLIGMGGASFWPVLLAAVTGAVAGDGIGFWLGRHFREQLSSKWPFRRHPEWLSRGSDFFRHHGAKSILFGRFVGPLRPIVPLAAGMLGMRPAAFYAFNLLSALAWAPAHLLPGMAFGATLVLASAVAGRLAALLLLLGALTWFVLWFVRWLFQVLSPRAALLVQHALDWGSRHPGMSRITGGFLDPAQPELKSLLAMAALLIGSAWLFLGVLEDVVSGDPLVRADQSIYALMRGLRTPWGDRVMVLVTELGDGVVIALVAAAVLAWLLLRRSWRAALYWSAAIGFGQVAATTIKLALQRPRPFTGLYEGLAAYAFPSGHAAMSMVAYGFLAVLVARNISAPRRWFAYGVFALLISLIAVSRLYLGAHWLSDVLGGLSLGLAWVCLLGIAYIRHPGPASVPPAVALFACAVAGGGHVALQYSQDLARYAPRLASEHLQSARWWQEDWRRLPAYRQDLGGEFEQPLNVQWSGTLASLREKLRAHGWREPVPLGAATALRWLLPAPKLDQLPLPPQFHAGREEVLRMIYPLAAGNAGSQQLVIRLWQTSVILDPQAVPLWLGSVSYQKLERLPLLTFPVADRHYDEALFFLCNSLDKKARRLVHRPGDEIGAVPNWAGAVLLMRDL